MQVIRITPNVGPGNRLWVNSKISNWPGNKLKVDASGAVGMTNFPQSQTVDGTVSVDNLPDVSGTVAVSNLPSVQPVSGSVSVNNLPAMQDVAVSNFPQVQQVDVVKPVLPHPSSIVNLRAVSLGNSAPGACDGFSYVVPVGKVLLITDVTISGSTVSRTGLWTQDNLEVYTQRTDSNVQHGPGTFQTPLVVLEGDTLCPFTNSSGADIYVNGQLVPVQ